MVSVQSKSVWMKRQQCPCGDWKCFVTYEGDTDEGNVGFQSIKNDSGPIEPMVSPYVGMVFKSDDEAFEYYGNFARKNGFSIRKERSRLSPQLGVYKRDFVCYRSGFAPPRKKQAGEHQRERKSVRCGCDAKMYLSKEVVDGDSQWFVVQFSNVHNHELLEDDQVRLLPAYRKIHEADQERILLLSKAGFPIHRIVKVLELEKGIQGGQLSFLERDVRNFIQNRKKVVQENDALLTEKRENDTVDLLEACRANKEADPFFVYDVAVDANDKVENVAWSFGDSIHAYNMFSDVLYFDSTYGSMVYGMLFGAWFGIDNHGKLIFFGCALMQDVTPQAFVWSLQAFLRFMKGRCPQTIITDIDPGLREAIRSEMPNTKHVISVYNILPRMSCWFSLPLGPRFSRFKYEFEELCHLENTEEYEFRWNQMVSQFGINSDKHIALLFSLRTCWALPYIRGCFLARMDCPSYWKSLDIVLKEIVMTQTCLRGFLEQTGLLSNYKMKSHDQAQYTHLKTCLPIEEHARNVLTPFAFDRTQQEMVLAMQYAASEMANGSYLVHHFKKVDGERLVIWIPEDEQIHCSCKEFESTGILCRHALRVLLFKNYFQLPSKYLLNRWCQESSLFCYSGESNIKMKDEWYQEFHSLTGTLFSEAMLTKERSDFVERELKKELTKLTSQVRDMPAVDEVVTDVTLSPNNAL
ncbi:FAR1-related sequence 10 [Perilla frutescens var. hirtella]|nr:FAR1-related sequence 10 [Perilla frutescens var. frutescens]KAH6787747.1 FAR1-related sequence 10 [Perilla frutescens var. hirtella]